MYVKPKALSLLTFHQITQIKNANEYSVPTKTVLNTQGQIAYFVIPVTKRQVQLFINS